MTGKAATISVALLVICFRAQACEPPPELALDEALAFAADLPQTDGGDPTSANERFWITSTRRHGTGYGYLIHDIAIQYARGQCWQPAREAIAMIASPGVRDSASAHLAIELARADRFDEADAVIASLTLPDDARIARDGVADELIRVGRIEEARTVRRRAGLFDNELYSFFTKHATSLATHGYEREALDYVAQSGRALTNLHVSNSYGAMLELFVRNGDMAHAAEIARLYEGRDESPAPDRQLAIYYATQGEHDKAEAHLARIENSAVRAWSYFVVADAASGGEYYRKGKRSVKSLVEANPERYWPSLAENIASVARHEDAAEARRFLEGIALPDTVDGYPKIQILGSAHMEIAGYLLTKAPRETVAYLDSVDHSIDDWSVAHAVAQIRAGEVTALPVDAATTQRLYDYRAVILDALTTEMPKQGVLAVADETLAGEANLRWKAEVYEVAAWQLADTPDGEREARRMLPQIGDPLLRARWLLGIAEGLMHEPFDPTARRGWLRSH
jgi:hypothetical protein